jgi:hypothetical protein
VPARRLGVECGLGIDPEGRAAGLAIAEPQLPLALPVLHSAPLSWPSASSHRVLRARGCALCCSGLGQALLHGDVH